MPWSYLEVVAANVALFIALGGLISARKSRKGPV